MAIELGDQGMSDQDERSPSGGVLKGENHCGLQWIEGRSGEKSK